MRRMVLHTPAGPAFLVSLNTRRQWPQQWTKASMTDRGACRALQRNLERQAGPVALAEAAARAAGCRPGDIRVVRTLRGPITCGPRGPVHVSLSHDGAVVLAAASTRMMLGIDLQHPSSRCARVVKRFAGLELEPEPALRAWTLAEAAAKVLGSYPSRILRTLGRCGSYHPEWWAESLGLGFAWFTVGTATACIAWIARGEESEPVLASPCKPRYVLPVGEDRNGQQDNTGRYLTSGTPHD